MDKLDMILEKLDSMEKKMDAMQEDIDILKESQEETRSGVNALLEWAEECGNVIKFPLPRVK